MGKKLKSDSKAIANNKKSIAKSSERPKNSKGGNGSEHQGKRGGNNNDEMNYKQHWKAFSDQLFSLGLRLKSIAPDGNCLFRSVCDQFEGSQDNFDEYRQETVTFMEDHTEDFAPFVPTDGGFDNYCAKMRRDKTWGGNLELVAVARRFRCNVVIHQFDAPRLEIKCPDAKVGENIRTIHLSYHLNEHYSSVRNKDDNIFAPPTTIKLRVASSLISSSSSSSPAASISSSGAESVNERAVSRATGCKDFAHIRELLCDVNNDVDSAVQILLAEAESKYELEDKQREDEHEEIERKEKAKEKVNGKDEKREQIHEQEVKMQMNDSHELLTSTRTSGSLFAPISLSSDTVAHSFHSSTFSSSSSLSSSSSQSSGHSLSSESSSTATSEISTEASNRRISSSLPTGATVSATVSSTTSISSSSSSSSKIVSSSSKVSLSSDKCSCGSGKKWKKCCGKMAKIREKLDQMILNEYESNLSNKERKQQKRKKGKGNNNVNGKTQKGNNNSEQKEESDDEEIVQDLGAIAI